MPVCELRRSAVAMPAYSTVIFLLFSAFYSLICFASAAQRQQGIKALVVSVHNSSTKSHFNLSTRCAKVLGQQEFVESVVSGLFVALFYFEKLFKNIILCKIIKVGRIRVSERSSFFKGVLPDSKLSNYASNF